jgi:hypothetical protein
LVQVASLKGANFGFSKNVVQMSRIRTRQFTTGSNDDSEVDPDSVQV